MDFLNDAETKAAAFEPVDGERSVPIDVSGSHEFKFTRSWFRQRNQSTFSTFLPPKFRGRRARRRPFRMIQIGVFEGMDLVWSCQNLLGDHPDSRILAIDPWAETRKLNADRMNDVHRRAEWNLRPWRKKIKLVRGYSEDLLPEAVGRPVEIHGQRIESGQWDLIVIDGDHRAPAVLEDARNSLQLVRRGGWLLFDDVRNRIKKKDHVADALRTFLEEHGDEVKLAWFNRFCNCYEKL